MNTNKNILIVEDDISMQKSLIRAIRNRSNGTINIFSAHSIEEAIIKFEENKDNLHAIAFDGYLETNDGLTQNTIMLIEKIKSNFSGVMIAMSSSLAMQQVQLEKGCNHSVNSKADLPDLIISLM